MKIASSPLVRRLFEPADIASTVLFRLLFGAILFWECTRYLSRGWVKEYWVQPTFFFKYPGFEWVAPWPGNGMYIHFYILAIASAFVMFGFLYRWSAALVFLGFVYIFLLDQANYLNHFYFLCLVAFWMIFIPANRAWSVDALFSPAIKSETVPWWSIWILRFQVGVLYFFGGVAKINSDWLIHAEPLRSWLADLTDVPLIGQWFTHPWTPYLFSWSGLLIDLCCVPFMLWKRTRLAAFLILVSFHLMNSRLFEIGIFPWFAIAITTIFFEPDWCRPFLNLFRFSTAEKGASARISKSGKGTSRIKAKHSDMAQAVLRPAEAPPEPGPLPGRRLMLVALLAVFVVWQLLFPLRHFLFPGDVNWTEEGHRFSWHMKLRTKDSGVVFKLRDPASGKIWGETLKNYLTGRQITKMSGHPDMILQFAHHLAHYYAQKGLPNVEVYAQAAVRLNGRRALWLIDTSVNLAAQPRRQLRRYDWVLPLPDSVLPRKAPAKTFIREEADGI